MYRYIYTYIHNIYTYTYIDTHTAFHEVATIIMLLKFSNIFGDFQVSFAKMYFNSELWYTSIKIGELGLNPRIQPFCVCVSEFVSDFMCVSMCVCVFVCVCVL